MVTENHNGEVCELEVVPPSRTPTPPVEQEGTTWDWTVGMAAGIM